MPGDDGRAHPRSVHAGLGAIHGGLAVIAGAFGAHGLKATLSIEALGWWRTAADYHLAHALALLATGLYVLRMAEPARALRAALIAFQAGVVLFSGSLYLMALTDLRALGAVTPLGGTAFIVGWGLLAWHLLRNAKPRPT